MKIKIDGETFELKETKTEYIYKLTKEVITGRCYNMKNVIIEDNLRECVECLKSLLEEKIYNNH